MLLAGLLSSVLQFLAARASAMPAALPLLASCLQGALRLGRPAMDVISTAVQQVFAFVRVNLNVDSGKAEKWL